MTWETSKYLRKIVELYIGFTYVREINVNCGLVNPCKSPGCREIPYK